MLWEPPWGTGEKPASIERMAYPLPDKPSIVVLPFLNLSDDPSQAYFADGMTDDLITDLAKISGMFVISRNSAFAYREDSVRLQQVAEELGVRYVLEGSVRRVGDDLRINAQLIDATTGGHLWAERYRCLRPAGQGHRANRQSPGAGAAAGRGPANRCERDRQCRRARRLFAWTVILQTAHAPG
jgi:TolB-like protein